MRLVTFHEPPARMRRTTHCKHGHPLTPENAYVHPKGTLICRQCKKDSDKRHMTREALKILDLEAKVKELEKRITLMMGHS